MSEDIHEMTHGADKRVALLIAFLALFLFFGETLGKVAQHHSTESNIKSSDLYNFFQAKKIRATLLESNAGQLELSALATTDVKVVEAMKKQAEEWKATAKRYEVEPEEGTKALLVRAKAASTDRDLYNLRLQHYEIASGLLQLGIVIASASIITGISALILLSGALGLGGVGLLGLGYLSPHWLAMYGILGGGH